MSKWMHRIQLGIITLAMLVGLSASYNSKAISGINLSEITNPDANNAKGATTINAIKVDTVQPASSTTDAVIVSGTSS